ncbi:AMP-binding protein [Georgenia sp. 10Sc9-8]|uniref:AMP-binding protein n=1 Tax=Georgenia halotolerans TaxID=3028317 RepID=A0ABT5U0A7_9MICO|nr:AMP-binding protein [Georgenia halotolerans]
MSPDPLPAQPHHPTSGGAGRHGYTRVLPLAGGTRPADVARLAAVLVHLLGPAGAREGTVVLPHPPGVPARQVLAETGPATAIPPGTAVLLRTSGSTTGRGHVVALGAAALTASARATERRLSGPGHWLLPLPTHHVAGLQVLVRSAVAGTVPVVLDTSAGFDPARLARTVRELPAGTSPWYTSLVPTQLVRLLAAGEDAVAPLRRFAAILVGGAGTPPDVLAGARDAGLAVVTTYGMTETGGGCVYDGVPLPGVRLALEDDGQRLRIGGPMVATGYVDDPEADAATFVTEGEQRWLRTSDRGELRTRGGRQHLTVLGRVDDVITTGGVKVSPGEVEDALAAPGVELVVVGVPDPEWGELVTAVVVDHDGTVPDLPDVRARVRDRVGGAHAPRALVHVQELPLLGSGKVDRRAAARLAADRLARPGAAGTERHR